MTAVVLRGDARRLPLPDACADLIVCSPPYFGLRSYTDGGAHYSGQIGSEATPAEYIAALAECTREWVRVLKPSGSLFVNLGDKYATRSTGQPAWSGSSNLTGGRQRMVQAARPLDDGRPKSLLGLPWRYALACIDELGLILRAEIIWDKPNGLPESVTDRVRRSHEQVFHFTVRPRYYAAVDEIREPQVKIRSGIPGGRGNPGTSVNEGRLKNNTLASCEPNPLGKLPGSVWSIPSAPLVVPERLGVDHFAAYPPELVRRIVLGWSPPGVCVVCGEGRRPVTDKRYVKGQSGTSGFKKDGREPLGRLNGTGMAGKPAMDALVSITGYACACPQPDAPTRPALVVDPFGGTGTTALVASVLGRLGITVDMSGDYCRLAAWRTRDPGERARALGVPKPPPVPDGQGSLWDELPA